MMNNCNLPFIKLTSNPLRSHYKFHGIHYHNWRILFYACHLIILNFFDLGHILHLMELSALVLVTIADHEPLFNFRFQ